MELVGYISRIIIPLIILYIVCYGLIHKYKVFELFTDGVKEGFKIVIEVAPSLVGLFLAVSIIRDSGALDYLALIIKPIAGLIHVPVEIVPLVIIRQISASAANGLLLDIYKEYGTDSYIGYASSLIMSCSETLLYTLAVYFGSVKVTKSRWTLVAAIIVMISGITASFIITSFIF